MRKNYNYTRRKLYLPEYGRHIHEMVDSLLEIEDRQERTRQAKAVIAVMGNLNTTLRDTEDFKHKLWDHLFIMSDFQLDVDSPYPQPSRQDLAVVPRKLPYPQSRITFKHYGKYVMKLVRTIAAEHNTELKTAEMLNIARYMRTKSFEFNNEHPNNGSIIRDINIMAGGEVDVDLTAVNAMRCDYRHTPQRNLKRNKPQQGRNNNRNKMAKGGGQVPQRNKTTQRHTAHK